MWQPVGMTQDDTTARPANPDDAGMPKSGDPRNLTGLSIDAELLRLTLNGRRAGVREQVRQLEIKSYSPPAYDLDTESHRARILERAWFLEHNRLSDSRAKDVTRAVDELCAELRPYVATLIDALGIPAGWVMR